MRLRWITFGVVVLLLGTGLLIFGLARGKGRIETITLATPQGIPFMVTLAMEKMVNDLLPGVKASTQIADSEQGVLKLVSSGRSHFGLVTIPEIARTFPEADQRNRSGLSFVMGGHVAMVAHLFVRRDVPINTISDLTGRRVGLPEPGSEGEAMAKAILVTYGLNYKDIKPIFMRVEEQVKAFEVGFVDAVILTVPVPSPVVSSPAAVKLANTAKARLLSLDLGVIERLLQSYPAYSQQTIEAGTYPGQAAGVLSVAVKSAIVAQKELSPDLVYLFLKTITENPEDFKRACPLAPAYLGKNALPGTALLSLHLGAERYYREKGIL